MVLFALGFIGDRGEKIQGLVEGNGFAWSCEFHGFSFIHFDGTFAFIVGRCAIEGELHFETASVLSCECRCVEGELHRSVGDKH